MKWRKYVIEFQLRSEPNRKAFVSRVNIIWAEYGCIEESTQLLINSVRVIRRNDWNVEEEIEEIQRIITKLEQRMSETTVTESENEGIRDKEGETDGNCRIPGNTVLTKLLMKITWASKL